jgi:hypothetical protein
MILYKIDDKDYTMDKTVNISCNKVYKILKENKNEL